MSGAPRFAIVTPAYNAGATLAETLASVTSQARSDWELIVVDDGSTDETPQIARAFAATEPRCQVITQANGGDARARNAGVQASVAPWVVFLDSDDWLLPGALAAFADQAEADPNAGVIVGDWQRVSADGTVVPVVDTYDVADIFDVTARYCPFAIHAAAVRREHVERSGGFDPALPICTDWDFWQRIARLGARFSRTAVAVARYRTRPDSKVMRPWALLDTGLQIIDRGHATDPRLPAADPAYAAGRVPAGRAAARIYFAVWPAAMLLGLGQSADDVLQRLDGDGEPNADPGAIARSLYAAALLPTASPPRAWIGLYTRIAGNIQRFLTGLEGLCGTPALGANAMRELERLIAAGSVSSRASVQIGGALAITMEVTDAIGDVTTDAGCHTLHVRLTLEGEPLGALEFPVSGGLVRNGDIADAIAAQHAWRILGAFFAATVYPTLLVSPIPAVGVRRGLVRVGPAPPRGTRRDDPAFHDLVGWCVFLQELWGKPYWPERRFYEGAFPVTEPVAPPQTGESVSRMLDVSEDTGWARAAGRVGISVGGKPLFVAHFPSGPGLGRAAAIATVMKLGGDQLCRAAVREALLGQPLHGGPALRARLAAEARHPRRTVNS